MIISSWNVNSVRARIENIKEYLKKFSPDIVMIQEIKTEVINFPYDEFKTFEYESHVFGQKSYNGVAILSKNKLQNIRTDLIKDRLKQSRIISALGALLLTNSEIFFMGFFIPVKFDIAVIETTLVCAFNNFSKLFISKTPLLLTSANFNFEPVSLHISCQGTILL
jgi:exonuclease III